jgi:ATP-binding cassette subfamily B (MDR/TAP) protein 1
MVISSVLPVLIASQLVMAKLNFGAQQTDRAALVQADAVAAEALGAIKTVAAFNMQPTVARLYHQQLRAAAPGRTALVAGLGFGSSQFILMAISSLSFWFGGTQIAAGHIDFRQMLTAFFSIFYASFGIAQVRRRVLSWRQLALRCSGFFASCIMHAHHLHAPPPTHVPPLSCYIPLQAQAAFPDLSKAADAVQRVFRVLDTQPSVDPSSTAGVSVELEGRVELRRVAFAYPSRPQRLVLKEFSLSVAAGASCALVGESGHGKSTIVGLLERFYDPVDGQAGGRVLVMRCSNA